MSKKPDDKVLQKVDIAAETLTALLVCDTKTEAAKMLGIHRDTLYKRIDQYNLQSYLDNIQEDALEVLRKGTIKAAKNFVDKIDHHKAEISMEASKEILDRAGVKIKDGYSEEAVFIWKRK